MHTKSAQKHLFPAWAKAGASKYMAAVEQAMRPLLLQSFTFPAPGARSYHSWEFVHFAPRQWIPLDYSVYSAK